MFVSLLTKHNRRHLGTSCAIAALFIYFYLPEVRGRTLEEMFVARLPARKFRKHVCTSQADIESKMRDARASEEKDEETKDAGTQAVEKVFGDRKAVADVVETAMHVA